MIKAYIEHSGILLKQSSFREALGLSMDLHRVVSFVGAGGKTSLMYQLAGELAGLGKRVIVTTSTHIAYPEDKKVICPETVSQMKKSDWENIWDGFVKDRDAEEIKGVPAGYLVAGRPVKEGKLAGFDQLELGNLLDGADFLLIEADGAKHLPLKVPAAHEPVIIPKTDLVVACAGLDCVDQPLEKVCFRLKEAELLLGKHAKAWVTAKDVAVIMTSESGGRKQAGKREYCVVLNKADSQERMKTALEIAEHMKGKSLQVPGFSGVADKSGYSDGQKDCKNSRIRCVVTTFVDSPKDESK